MAIQTSTYGTRAVVTISPGSLAVGAYRESTEIDNGSTQAVDGVAHGVVTAGTSPAAGGTISVYVSGSDGSGSVARPGNLTGTDSTITPAGEQTQFVLAAVIPVDGTSNHAYEFYIGSIAALFGGVMPKKFSFIILNGTSVALNATAGNHVLAWTPITYTVA